MHIEKAQIIPNTQNTAIQIATIYCHILSSFAVIPGNRMNGIQEVRGSIPLISTTTNKSEPCADWRWVRIIAFLWPLRKHLLPKWGEAKAHLQAERPTEEEAGPINAKRAGAAVCTVRPPFSSLLRFGLLPLRLPLLLPFGKFPLALLALVESENVRHDTAGYRLDLVLGNVGVVD